MKLPNLAQAHVPHKKITNYLLNTGHESGRGKALFFIYFGFSVAQWEVLAQTLLDHAQNYEVIKQEQTSFGTRYVIEGTIETPAGRTPLIRTVWFIANEQQQPQLVTAYPLETKDHDDSGI